MKKNLVRGEARKTIARPQPAMQDRRTKRTRDRGAAKRAAIRDAA